MELKDFVKNVLVDLVNAVEEARSGSERDMHLRGDNEGDIVFDIAVTVEESKAGGGKAGIKVWGLIEAGGDASKEIKNSTVSRIKFGVHVSGTTKKEEAERLNQFSPHRRLENPGR